MKEDVLPEGWEKINIQKAFSQVSTTGKKIPTKDILPFGKYPVIDQGEEFISGYFNNKDKVISANSGIVIFGDHTRNFKLVNFDFIPGGDGTKILKPNVGIDLEFFYFQCLYLELPDKGYHRHFKYFKESNFYLPPLPEQQYLSQKLTALLDEVVQTKQRLEAIPALLKQFRQSVLADAVSGRLTEEWRSKNIHSAEEEFISLEKNEQDYLDKKLKDNYTTIFKEKAKLRNQVNIFNKVNIPEGWVEKPFFELCLLNRGFDLPTSQRTKGKYPILSAGGIIDYHNEFKVRGECVTVGRSGSVGQVFYTPKDCWVLNTALYVKDFGISIPKFVYYKLQAMNLAQYSSSTAVPTLNRNEFMFVPVTIPPKEEQTQIVQKVETYFALADEIEAQVKAALENVNLLTQSILAKAFNGELSAAWRNSQVTETQGNV